MNYNFFTKMIVIFIIISFSKLYSQCKEDEEISYSNSHSFDYQVSGAISSSIANTYSGRLMEYGFNVFLYKHKNSKSGFIASLYENTGTFIQRSDLTNSPGYTAIGISNWNNDPAKSLWGIFIQENNSYQGILTAFDEKIEILKNRSIVKTFGQNIPSQGIWHPGGTQYGTYEWSAPVGSTIQMTAGPYSNPGSTGIHVIGFPLRISNVTGNANDIIAMIGVRDMTTGGNYLAQKNIKRNTFVSNMVQIIEGLVINNTTTNHNLEFVVISYGKANLYLDTFLVWKKRCP